MNKILWKKPTILWILLCIISELWKKQIPVNSSLVQFNKKIVLPRKLATGNIYDYLFCYCPLLGIIFEIVRIGMNKPLITLNRVYTYMESCSGHVASLVSYGDTS